MTHAALDLPPLDALPELPDLPALDELPPLDELLALPTLDTLPALADPLINPTRSLTTIAFTEEDIARFWSNVDRGAEDACWPWLAGRDDQGYGKCTIGGITLRAHRVALWLARREEGPVTRHTCDHEPCCNPAHLIAGTQKQNRADAVDRGRVPTGEKHHNATLTDEQVAEIRRRHKPRNGAALAREFGVVPTTISNIVGGKHRFKKVAGYSESLSDNIHCNTPERELEIIRRFATIGLDPCSNPTSTVGAVVDWWGPPRKCAICGAPATHGLSLSTADRCEAHTATDVEPALALLRARIPDAVLQDRRYGVDGLAMSPWGAYLLPDQCVFLQPPYGKLIIPWITKANEERDAGCGIIGLLPGRFDTKWFRAMRPDRICWYGRRIPFVDSTKPGQKDSAKFPSVFPYWGRHTARFEEIFGEHGVVTSWRMR